MKKKYGKDGVYVKLQTTVYEYRNGRLQYTCSPRNKKMNLLVRIKFLNLLYIYIRLKIKPNC